MFEVQKLYNDCLFTNDNLRFLGQLDELGIEVKDYPDHKMWLFNYSQIDSIKNHPVVNECRGLLMGYDGKIIRKGFTRFYNLGENGVDTFDFENSIAFEKADGSLMFIYWCSSTNQWEIGTRGTAFAEGPNEWHGTFRAFMLFAMGRTEEQFQSDCSNMNKDVTRLCEAIGPDNRIVTPYVENKLVSLSFVNNITGDEVVAPGVAYEKGLGWNIREVRQYRFDTKEDCMIALAELKGLEEGYVVYNLLTKDRVKIKNAVYLAAHRLRGNGLTLNAICELVAMNEHGEYIAVFPEDEEKFVDAIDALELMLDRLEMHYENHYTIESQKEFALEVKDLPMSAVYFKARGLKLSIVDAFKQFPVSKRAEWIKDMLS